MKRSIGWPLVVNALRMGGSLMAIIAGVMLYDGFIDDDMDDAFVLGLIVSSSFTLQFLFRGFFEEQVKGGEETNEILDALPRPLSRARHSLRTAGHVPRRQLDLAGGRRVGQEAGTSTSSPRISPCLPLTLPHSSPRSLAAACAGHLHRRADRGPARPPRRLLMSRPDHRQALTTESSDYGVRVQPYAAWHAVI